MGELHNLGLKRRQQEHHVLTSSRETVFFLRKASSASFSVQAWQQQESGDEKMLARTVLDNFERAMY